MNKTFFWKKYGKCKERKTDFQIITIEIRKIYFVEEQNYRTNRQFSEYLLEVEIKQVVLNKPVYSVYVLIM